MDLFNNLILGFSVALTLQNLAYCFVGVLLGTLIGVLPGIGPLATIAMLLPLTFNVSATSAMIMSKSAPLKRLPNILRRKGAVESIGAG